MTLEVYSLAEKMATNSPTAAKIAVTFSINLRLSQSLRAISKRSISISPDFFVGGVSIGVCWLFGVLVICLLFSVLGSREPEVD